MLPLQKIPMYQANAYPNRYWTAARNTTAWNLEMAELTNAGNTMARLMLKDLTPTLPGAHVGKSTDVDGVESVVYLQCIDDFCRIIRLICSLLGHYRPSRKLPQRDGAPQRD